MSGKRFELLMKYLHLNDMTKQPSRESADYDKLYKIWPFLDKIRKSFKQEFIPDKNVWMKV